jgi:hypothetical protein
MLRTVAMILSLLPLLALAEGRRRVVVLESGVRKTEALRPFLCDGGHRSYIRGSFWDEDSTGHGTAIAEVLAQGLNPATHCITVYKVSGLIPRPQAYLGALRDLAAGTKPAVVLAAIEGTSASAEETSLLARIASASAVVVAGGNGGVSLGEGCSVYPACLKGRVGGDFSVVGAPGFNRGSLVDQERDPRHGSLKGSSFSAARYAAEVAKLRSAHPR